MLSGTGEASGRGEGGEERDRVPVRWEGLGVRGLREKGDGVRGSERK